VYHRYLQQISTNIDSQSANQKAAEGVVTIITKVNITEWHKNQATAIGSLTNHRIMEITEAQ